MASRRAACASRARSWTRWSAKPPSAAFRSSATRSAVPPLPPPPTPLSPPPSLSPSLSPCRRQLARRCAHAPRAPRPPLAPQHAAHRQLPRPIRHVVRHPLRERRFSVSLELFLCARLPAAERAAPAGLYTRYAAALLASPPGAPGAVAGLEAADFVTTATPHLGVKSFTWRPPPPPLPTLPHTRHPTVVPPPLPTVPHTRHPTVVPARRCFAIPPPPPPYCSPYAPPYRSAHPPLFCDRPTPTPPRLQASPLPPRAPPPRSGARALLRPRRAGRPADRPALRTKVRSDPRGGARRGTAPPRPHGRRLAPTRAARRRGRQWLKGRAASRAHGNRSTIHGGASRLPAAAGVCEPRGRLPRPVRYHEQPARWFSYMMPLVLLYHAPHMLVLLYEAPHMLVLLRGISHASSVQPYARCTHHPWPLARHRGLPRAAWAPRLGPHRAPPLRRLRRARRPARRAGRSTPPPLIRRRT